MALSVSSLAAAFSLPSTSLPTRSLSSASTPPPAVPLVSSSPPSGPMPLSRSRQRHLLPTTAPRRLLRSDLDELLLLLQVDDEVLCLSTGSFTIRSTSELIMSVLALTKLFKYVRFAIIFSIGLALAMHRHSRIYSCVLLIVTEKKQRWKRTCYDADPSVVIAFDDDEDTAGVVGGFHHYHIVVTYQGVKGLKAPRGWRHACTC
ncbi:hypothetical protein TRIUR3_30024 [Triticum urartu]|uniref:Uncharacterized protein n=1 Tax=Triticum urartu TaxID=4572 RepID=M7ZHI1_TRIUA|nr:hypothetical protein TRIUR3_30024 [Triticum urartu]